MARDAVGQDEIDLIAVLQEDVAVPVHAGESLVQPQQARANLIDRRRGKNENTEKAEKDKERDGNPHAQACDEWGCHGVTDDAASGTYMFVSARRCGEVSADRDQAAHGKGHRA